MNKRIRYTKKDNKLVSIGEVISTKGVTKDSRYIVVIDLVAKTYYIKNVVSHRKYEGGEGVNNMNVLKRNIKKHLAHLGIEFEKEVRNRTFGKCGKNWNQSKELEKRKSEQENNSPS